MPGSLLPHRVRTNVVLMRPVPCPAPSGLWEDQCALVRKAGADEMAERRMSRIQWQQDQVAGVPLNRHVGFVGPVEVGSVAYDGSNRFWIWSTPLQEDAWGYGPTEQGAKTALELWLASWLENFRSFFQTDSDPPSS
jgi:hypothetical protein